MKPDIDIEKVFHIKEIPEKELRIQYHDLSFVLSTSCFGGNFVGYKGDVLAESAETTLSAKETERQIMKKLRLKDWQFEIRDGASGTELIILYPGIFRNTLRIRKAMEACGWFVSARGYIVYRGMIWKAMSFDPMFLDSITSEIRKEKYLFHWTPAYKMDAIRKEGLLPKSENSVYKFPPRIHLIKGNASFSEILQFGTELSMTNKNKLNDGKYFLLTIETSKLPSDTEMFPDARYEFGCYVDIPIQYSAIKDEHEYRFPTP